ncbi:hypothetical protein SCHPADRAFT_71299 [Schizopora paradoxa]|uniref:CBS domain-containing protein n=1 Tax=Schizopora paradoxa TaxID=27342 RepID=A0A0H2S5U6_9AGAM|nr:hypothetical protein SCHPADRAFT_71299 [Schizopora paradoxa]
MSSSTGRESPLVFAPNVESEEWIREWETVQAKDLVDGPVIAIDGETSVDDACAALISNNTDCLAVKSGDGTIEGLFDFADVNAFLILAANLHALSQDFINSYPVVKAIINAANGDAGRVPVKLVCNLSEKNPLSVLPSSASLIDLLAVFAKGIHRVLIRAPASSSSSFLGYTSAFSLLRYFLSSTPTVTLHRTNGPPSDEDALPLSPIPPSWHTYLSTPLHSLSDLPSLSLHGHVAHISASSSVLDAMRALSLEGVRSVAVVSEDVSSGGPGGGSEAGHLTLLSTVSVTDIGKLVTASGDKSILNMPISQFVSMIKLPGGVEDGMDRFPVYNVVAANSLRFTMEKLLATMAHRVYVTAGNHPSSTSAGPQLVGVVSVVDVLYLFARLANLHDIHPSRMVSAQRTSPLAAGIANATAHR